MKNLHTKVPISLICSSVFFCFSACFHEVKEELNYDQLTDEQKRLPEFSLAGISIADGLEATLFASEPAITKPTNIDIDHRGRVWVLEAFNYRPEITGNDIRPEGDRILILEDTDGDGIHDKSTVFYQGPELNAPLGIWVMGNQAIVSQSPYVWLFTDTNGNDIADKKEIIFQGISGEQHDHGMHSFVFGPDGKYYFNFGNSGGQLLDKNNDAVKDKFGVEINTKNFKEGLVFRSDTDFRNIEVLGQNFRNNYEVAVDSYGTMWQSDNDDDGNKGVRINYVMDYGNYGYKDEMTNASWTANRTNKEKEIPHQHWHLNDPGVVPNLLQTGAGSPTGILVYEGRLLPEIYWDQMIHADAGPNVVRSYPVKKNGAGYTAEIINIMVGEQNQWFRPSDVCIAPDGSLFIADWHDPGVGGHQVGDLSKGRIFRLAPPKTSYKIPSYDLTNIDGALEALQNPNLSWRYQAWKALQEMGPRAEKKLLDMFENHQNPRMKARALWVLINIEGKGEKYVEMAISHRNPDIQIVGLRAARQLNIPLIPVVSRLVKSSDSQVRREVAISLRNIFSPEAAEIWAALALQHDGHDRWYLEALGIGAHHQWDSYFAAWKEKVGEEALYTKANKDIVWRSRTGTSVPMLAVLALSTEEPIENRLRYFRAFDFNPDAGGKSAALIKMLDNDGADQKQINKLVIAHLDPKFVLKSPKAMAALEEVINDSKGTQEFVELVSKFELKKYNSQLLEMAITNRENNLGRNSASALMELDGKNLIEKKLASKVDNEVIDLVLALRGIGSKESISLLESVAFNSGRPINVRREAAAAIGGSYSGEDRVLELLREEKFPDNLKASAVNGLSRAWRRTVRLEASQFLGDGNESDLPPLNDLMAMEGSIEKGKTVFDNMCALCHMVGDEGKDFGPKLTEIGSKLSKEAQYIAILHPDAGISFGFEGHILKTKDGDTYGGIISNRTETDLDFKIPGGTVINLKVNNIVSIEQMDNSMMPTGLENAMTPQELVDLVEYLMSLKKISE